MTERILSFTDLQRKFWPGESAPRISTVVRWAESQGIRYGYDGRGGIWTTLDALNASLGISASQPPANDEPRIEDLMQ